MIENDAVMVAPDPGLGMAEVGRRLEARRVALEMQRNDPLRFGYEPDIWLVCRALLGMDSIPDIVRRSLADRTGVDYARCWHVWRDGLCSNFGMGRFCSEMLINGANRAGKTDFAAKLVNEIAETRNKLIWVGAAQADASIEVEQKRVQHYLPSDKKGRTIKTDTDYLNYSEKNGFTGASFCLHGSRVKFATYKQDLKAALEGMEYDFAWPDEEVPHDWLDALRMRTASRNGRIVCTFTPISGYTPVVADFQDGLRMVKTCTAYMLPRDGGDPLPWMALGLEKWEYEELVRRQNAGDKLPQRVPSSRAEECCSWGMSSTGQAQGAARTEGASSRSFDRVPRVGIKGDGGRCVVWFHGRDNPYGNPMEVIRKAMASTNAVEEIKKRVYGIALKAKGKRFKLFDKSVHVVA
jgi:phage terminase large subunit-like protein